MSPTALKSFHENFAACEENIRVLIHARERAEAEGNPDWILILNVNQFVSVFNYDLSLVNYDLNDLPPSWKRGLQGRVAALLLVEYMESVSALLGKEFRQAIGRVAGNHDQERFREICKAMSLMRKTHETDLRQIRNLAIAHREKDARVQIATVLSLVIGRI